MELKNILRGHANTLLERTTTKAILSDAYNNNISKVNALMSAYDIGIVQLILDNFPVSQIHRSNAVNKLIALHNMLDSHASWAIDKWIDTIDADIAKEIKAEQKAKEDERQAKITNYNSVDDALELISSHDIPSPASTEDKTENIDYYTNVSYKKQGGRIYIPCGVGNTDYGFFIIGIKEIDCSQIGRAHV